MVDHKSCQRRPNGWSGRDTQSGGPDDTIEPFLTGVRPGLGNRSGQASNAS